RFIHQSAGGGRDVEGKTVAFMGVWREGENEGASCARGELRMQAALVSVDGPVESEFVEVSEGIAVFNRHADRGGSGEQIEMARFEPDGAEDGTGQKPLGLGPTPVINQTPKTVMPGIARVVGGG